MSAAQKLTKRQKKAIAFRERRQGLGKGKDGEVEMDNDVPIPEDQDVVDVHSDNVEVEPVDEKAKKQQVQVSAKEGGESGELEFKKVVGKSKKRKRGVEVGTTEEDGAQVEKPKRKRKEGVVDDGEAEAACEEGDKKETQSQLKQRYILFVGNLRYTTSLEAIQAHFAACDPPPVIRLLTPKLSSSKNPTIRKSKGCAFLEFSHRNALQQALKLHQSELEGRMLNVELTAGGGGKSETRTTKLKERNKELFGQRKQRTETQATTDGQSILMMPDRPQRYSATSGIEQVPTRRTWTVGTSNDGETHRGGKRHAQDGKNRRPQKKALGTGVNAIPVG